MRSFAKNGISLAASLSLAACATNSLPNENYLDAGARQHIKTVDAVLITKQDRIAADVKQNATLGDIGVIAAPFTQIPMLLDIGVKAVNGIKADKMVKPIREKLEGHDYPYALRKQVRQSLSGTTLDGVEDFMILRGEYPGQRGRIIENSDADAVLLVDMKYGFTADFKSLYLASYAMLFPNHPELKQFQETPDRDRLLEYSDNIYRNQFSVSLSTNLEDAAPSEHAAIWAELSQEDLVEVLDGVALVMADTIANDIGFDDLDSDLDLIPEGYALNTKYDNFNKKFASIRLTDPLTDPLAEPAPNKSDAQTGSRPDEDVKLIPELDIEPKTGS